MDKKNTVGGNHRATPKKDETVMCATLTDLPDEAHEEDEPDEPDEEEQEEQDEEPEEEEEADEEAEEQEAGPAEVADPAAAQPTEPKRKSKVNILPSRNRSERSAPPGRRPRRLTGPERTTLILALGKHFRGLMATINPTKDEVLRAVRKLYLAQKRLPPHVTVVEAGDKDYFKNVSADPREVVSHPGDDMYMEISDSSLWEVVLEVAGIAHFNYVQETDVFYQGLNKLSWFTDRDYQTKSAAVPDDDEENVVQKELVKDLKAASVKIRAKDSEIDRIKAEADARVKAAEDERDLAMAEHSNCVPYFLELMRAALSTGEAHVADWEGGPPISPESAGWHQIDGAWVARGRCIGWRDKDNLYLDPDPAFETVQRMATAVGRPLGVKQKTLHKRLHDHDQLLSTDTKRSRLRTRIQLAGIQRSVLHLHPNVLLSPLPAANEAARIATVEANLLSRVATTSTEHERAIRERDNAVQKAADEALRAAAIERDAALKVAAAERDAALKVAAAEQATVLKTAELRAACLALRNKIKADEAVNSMPIISQLEAGS